MIILTVWGFLVFIDSALFFLFPCWASNAAGKTASADIFVGIVIIILLPVRYYFALRTAYNKSLRAHEKIEYDITDKGIIGIGETWRMEIDWSKTYKIEETKNWFLIYENPRSKIIIPKETMTVDDIKILKTILVNIKTIKGVKLLS